MSPPSAVGGVSSPVSQLGDLVRQCVGRPCPRGGGPPGGSHCGVSGTGLNVAASYFFGSVMRYAMAGKGLLQGLRVTYAPLEESVSLPTLAVVGSVLLPEVR